MSHDESDVIQRTCYMMMVSTTWMGEVVFYVDQKPCSEFYTNICDQIIKWAYKRI